MSMSRTQKPSKPLSQSTREDRLKAALKVNMARRKAQAKARAEKNETINNMTGNSSDDTEE